MECVDLDSDMFYYEKQTTTTTRMVVTTIQPTTSALILAEAQRNYIIGASVGVLVFLMIAIALHLKWRNVKT